MNTRPDDMIPTGFISRLEKMLGLTYVEGSGEGNICFANNNKELRDDFKQVFTRKDVLNYISVVKDDSENIPLPETAREFWEFTRKT